MGQFSSSKNFNYGYPTPGPQTPTGQNVMNHVFFVSDSEWKKVREEEEFDHIVIGSGFCALGFVERILENNPHSKILIIERGVFFLPEHFQNLPLPFKDTLGGLSEIFPWTLTSKTVKGEFIKWQHGMVPFFGGRSTLWSAWCPRPTKEEMINWPSEAIETAYKYFGSAERLLNVIPADKIRSVSEDRPVYAVLQKELQKILVDNIKKVPELTRIIAAPLAVNEPDLDKIDFSKFATPSELLELAEKQEKLELIKKGSAIKIVTNCLVNKIIQQDGKAIALDTSKGVVSIGKASLVLAMGTLPPATLMHNSFPQIKNIGERFTSHFITAIVARVSRADYSFAEDLNELELGAFYVAGTNKDLGNEGQFHIQLTALSDKYPQKNAKTALRYMPDVVATASMEQLMSSKDHVVFVCAVLGEINFKNKENWFRKNDADDNPSTNSILQVVASENDKKVWNSMDDSTFKVLEDVLSPEGGNKVEYWNNSTQDWVKEKPKEDERRVPGLVHEASTMWLGKDSKDSVTGLDYRPHGIENVYITGASLWPTGASWNPTMTMVAFSQHLADNLSK